MQPLNKIRRGVMHPSQTLSPKGGIDTGDILGYVPGYNPGFADGGLVKPEQMPQLHKATPVLAPGLIEGPGTGTSDSIDANLPVDGFVIPAAVVEFYGADFFDRMNDMADPESQAEDNTEGQEEVPAQVSDGEVFMSPAAVQAFGADAFNKLIASVTGQGAQPEMDEGEVHAAQGYDPDALERINKLTGVTGGKQASMPLSAEKAAAQLQPAPKSAPQLDPVQKTINSATGVAGRGQGSVPMSADMAKTQAAGNPVYKNAQAGTQAAELRARVPQLGTANTTNGRATPSLAPQAQTGALKPALFDVNAARDVAANAADNASDPNLRGKLQNMFPRRQEGWAERAVNAGIEGVRDLTGNVAVFGDEKKQQPRLAVKQPDTINTPVSKTGSISFPTDATGFVPTQTVSRLAAENSQASAQPQAQPRTLAPQIGKSQGWAENGLRTDGAPQTLDWNESRFSNSGDPEQDAALEYRRGINNQNSQNMSLINAGMPPQALVNDNPAARNASENTRAAQTLAGENSRAAQNNATELEKVRILAASRADSKDKNPAFKPAFNDADMEFLDPNTPDDERLAVGRVDKRAADKLAELYLSTDDQEERSKYVLQLSQLSGISPTNLTNLMLKKVASPQE